MKERKSNKKFKKTIYLTIIMLIIIATFVICNIQKTRKQNQIALLGYTNELDLNGIKVDITNLIGTPNAPQLTAGMIPIKYVNGFWTITSKDDKDWYDYSVGKMATVMLSDGYYTSELQVNNSNVAKSGTPVTTEKLGTIYVWNPKIAYKDDRFEYVIENGIIEADSWTTPSCFYYKRDNLQDLNFNGIWVEQNGQTSESDTKTKITAMQQEDNSYGLIANAKVEKMTGTVSKVVKKTQGQTVTKQQVKDITNTNRTVIKVLNTNNKVPIEVSLKKTDKTVRINIDYTENGIQQIVCVEDGLKISGGALSTTYTLTEAGTYTFIIVDEKNNTKMCTSRYGDGTPDLTGFRVDTTYVVMYTDPSDASTMIDTIPIKDILKDGYITGDNNTLISGKLDYSKIKDLPAEWYNYDEKKWANIVVRNFGGEAYFTWIPRYVYKLDSENQQSDIKFITTENTYVDDGSEVNFDEYSLPEAFTWTDEYGDEVSLPGFWVSKYELSNITVNLQATVIGGINKIRISGVTDSSGLGLKYKLYLYEAGTVDKDKVGGPNYVEQPGWVRYSENETQVVYYGLNSGVYDLRIEAWDSEGNYRAETWYYDIEVEDPYVAQSPDLTGFRIDTTYVVTYTDPSDASTIIDTIPIKNILKSGYQVDSNNALVFGEIDEMKVKLLVGEWYNYNEKKWANIVVRNFGGEAYFTWIPRYEYKLDSYRQESEIRFLSKNTPTDEGWNLPEAFTWTDLEGNEVALSGFWTSKYELSNISVNLQATIVSGVNKIRISRVTDSSGLGFKYKLYLYEVGTVEKDKVGGPNYVPQPNYVRYSENVTEVIYYGLNPGKYDLRIEAWDSDGNYRAETWYYDIEVQDATTELAPDLTGFRVDTTYIVTYSDPKDASTINDTILIKDILKEGYTVDSNNALVTGEIDPNKVNNLENVWYDYNEKKWANIVVKNAGGQAFFTWIPRYEYKLDSYRQESEIRFIGANEPVAEGWELPEAFSWTDLEGSNVNLKGFWVSKYELSS